MISRTTEGTRREGAKPSASGAANATATMISRFVNSSSMVA
jgi:hypothetical protein